MVELFGPGIQVQTQAIEEARAAVEDTVSKVEQARKRLRQGRLYRRLQLGAAAVIVLAQVGLGGLLLQLPSESDRLTVLGVIATFFVPLIFLLLQPGQLLASLRTADEREEAGN